MRTSASWWILNPRPGGHEVTQDDVLLEPNQVVDLTGQCRLGEDLGGLLEASPPR